MSAPIKVSVLGMGLSATVFHIPFIQSLPDRFLLHSVLERSATPTHSEARSKYGDHIKVVTSLEEILQDDQVQCVVISTPNSTHYPFAKAILGAGKHIIIEKPLVPTSKEATELITLAESHKPPLIIATYQNRRFDSDFLTLKNLLDKGIFGELSEFETRFDRFRPELKGGTWKEAAGWGQGIVFDLGSHLVDQVLTLFGTPSSVSAHIYNARCVGPSDFDDAFVAHWYYDVQEGLKLPLVVTIRGSPLSLMEPQLRFTVKGTKATFVKYGIDPQEDQLRLSPPLPLSDPSFGVESEANQGTLTFLEGRGKVISKRIPTENGRYIDWYKNVGDAIASGDPTKLYVKPEQARDTIRLIELMYQSSREGRVIKVSP